MQREILDIDFVELPIERPGKYSFEVKRPRYVNCQRFEIPDLYVFNCFKCPCFRGITQTGKVETQKVRCAFTHYEKRQQIERAGKLKYKDGKPRQPGYRRVKNKDDSLSSNDA